MIKLYISEMCPDCKAAVDYIKRVDDEYAILDITKSLAALKEFLKFRDTRDEFLPIKEKGSIGIPMFFDTQTENISFNVGEK